MYSYRIGGKDGKRFLLEESDRHVVVRTKRGTGLEDLDLTEESKAVLENLMPVEEVPEARVKVYECMATKGRELEMRNHSREVFKKQEGVDFAGRVLKDNKSQQIFIYTENFFVKFRDSLPEQQCIELIRQAEMEVKKKLPYAANAYFTQAEKGKGYEIFTLAEQLLDHEQTEYCHPELIQERRFKSLFRWQWHLHPVEHNNRIINAHVNTLAAWSVTRGEGIRIAVIDDGFDLDHPEFSGKGKIVDPYDAFLDSTDPRPKFRSENHGTPCAGVACASGNYGAAGVAPEALLMPIRAGNLGSVTEAAAFAWAADHGADVISCSWGPPDGNWQDPADPQHKEYAPLFDSTRLAIDYAINHGRNGKGCVIVWAAGNGNEDIQYDGYASYDKVIAVGASNILNKRATYSDFGKALMCCFPSYDVKSMDNAMIEIVRPGIWTTDRLSSDGYAGPGNKTYAEDGDRDGAYYGVFGGTSSACPGAAGVFALMLSINPQLTWMQIRSLIPDLCDKIDRKNGKYNRQGHSRLYGFGKLNAGKAVEVARRSKAEFKFPTLVGKLHFNHEVEQDVSTPARLEQPDDRQRLSGMSLKIEAFPGLGISYAIRAHGVSRQISGKNGELCELDDLRRKIVSVRIKLTGKHASRYTVWYKLRLHDLTEPIPGRDGTWTGGDATDNAAVVDMQVYLAEAFE